MIPFGGINKMGSFYYGKGNFICVEVISVIISLKLQYKRLITIKLINTQYVLRKQKNMIKYTCTV